MHIGTAIFLVGVFFFAIVFRGFRKFLIARAVVAGVCLIVGSVTSDHTTPLRGGAPMSKQSHHPNV
jgi:cell division protein FtsW (lipid II flippase)